MTLTAPHLAQRSADPGPGGPGDDRRPDESRCSWLDIDLHGLITIRLIDATLADRKAVEAQFGRARPTASITSPPPADITIRYSATLPQHGRLRYLGPDELGFTDDEFLVLQGRFRRPVTVMMRLGDLGGPFEVACQHGVGRVPHLVALVNLAILAAGGLALHASAYAFGDQPAALATGWSKGGKSEALLAAGQNGASYVADEWTHLHSDGRISGIVEPVRIWDWHLRQYPELQRSVAAGDQRRLAALRWAERAADRTVTSARIGTAIHRQRFVDLPATAVAPAGVAEGPVALGTVFLMTSTPEPAVAVRPLPATEVADRMTASLTYERLPLMALVAAHRFAFPFDLLEGFDSIAERERSRLHDLLADRPAAEVLHPYPVDLPALGAVMQTWNRGHR